jgi:hypothetical protein
MVVKEESVTVKSTGAVGTGAASRYDFGIRIHHNDAAEK